MITFEIRVIATFLAAFFAAMFVLPNLSLFAEKIGLVDVPNERKVHTVPRPLVGGIGIVIAATFSSLVFEPLLYMLLSMAKSDIMLISRYVTIIIYPNSPCRGRLSLFRKPGFGHRLMNWVSCAPDLRRLQ